MYISNPAPIKTRADGSIDTAHYIQRGLRMRSEAAHEMLGLSDAPKAPAPRRGFWQIFRPQQTA